MEFCLESAYEYYNLDELQDLLDKNNPSGNELFDEFWFNW